MSSASHAPLIKAYKYSVCFDKRMIGSINEGDDNDG